MTTSVLRQPARHPSPWRQAAKSVLSGVIPRSLLTIRAPAADGRVWLTFDDGPDPRHTARLLDVLRSLAVPATFFLVGEQAVKQPDLVRRIAAEGHCIGNHTYRHCDPSLLSAGELISEVHQTEQVLAEITGQWTRLFRPPHGVISASKLLRLWLAGRRVILWSCDPMDCEQACAEDVRAWFSYRPLMAGDIVLFHDDCPYAAAVLPELVSGARARNIAFAAPWQDVGAACSALTGPADGS